MGCRVGVGDNSQRTDARDAIDVGLRPMPVILETEGVAAGSCDLEIGSPALSASVLRLASRSGTTEDPFRSVRASGWHGLGGDDNVPAPLYVRFDGRRPDG